MAEEEAKAPEENAEATQPAEAGTDAANDAPAEAPPQPSMLVPMIVTVAICLAGTFGIFQFVIAPQIKGIKDAVAELDPSSDKNKTKKPEEKGETDGGSGGGEGSGGDGKDESGGPIPIVGEDENIIVNPAGSGGTRYLLVEVFLVRGNPNDKGFKAAIEGKTKELQDLTVNTLRRYPSDDLSDPVIQDTIKRRLKDLYEAELGPKHPIGKMVVPKGIMQ